MKRVLILYPSLAILIIWLSACTKVIDVDLNSSDPEIVIEGNVTTNGQNTIIKISRTVNFDESNTFPEVQGAIVILSDDLGNTEALSETIPGTYSSSTLLGMEGQTYYLSVESNGKTLTSTSTIPDQVSFDTLIVTEETNGAGPGQPNGGQTASYRIMVRYNDTQGVVNYYHFITRVNGEIVADYLFDDVLSDGGAIQSNLRVQRNLFSGDIIQIEMQCIDRDIYEYYESFANTQGGLSSSSTPANPYTNIENAVLGYFSAHTSELKEFIVP